MASLTDFINDATRDDMQRLEEALLRGEQLLWAVRPVPTAWTAATIPLIAFCPLWLGFIAFWTYAALGFPTSLAAVQALEGERMLFACFSLPFWLIGFWLLSSPWQQKRRMRATASTSSPTAARSSSRKSSFRGTRKPTR